MSNSIRAFYDELAGSYHLIFADWQASMRRQAAVLDRLIRTELGTGPLTVLDAACGIGTQAIGLAARGYEVHGTDLSPLAVERARREAAALGTSTTFGVGDMRPLATQVAGTFDVVLACDNALPHLLTDDDLRQAIDNMAAKLRPGGLFLASIRDYDRLVEAPPRTEGPRVFDDAEGRRISFQVWDWADDGCSYRVQQFLVRQVEGRWHTDDFATHYRALLHHDLSAAMDASGLGPVNWHEPENSGYYQPIVTARIRAI